MSVDGASTTADSASLLATARSALLGEFSLPAARATRAAALLARTALEAIVEQALARLGAPLDRAGMRVKLICLNALDSASSRPEDANGMGAEAAWAWAALSTACHHHAYELTPTAREVGHLLDVVEELQHRLAPDPH